jgi:hypothetical protein
MWVVNFEKTLAPTNMRIIPDRGVSATDNITSGNDLSISLTTNANRQTVVLYAILPQGETIVSEQYVENAGVVNIPVAGYSGKVRFKAIAFDIYGNESNPASVEVFIDNQDLSAEIIPVGNSDCFGELSYVSIRFTDDILAAEFTNKALSLNAGGTLLPTGNILITPVSDREFKVEKFDNVSNNGDITVGVNLAMLHKKLSGLQAQGVISQNIGNVSIYSAQISGNDIVTENDVVTYTASPDMLNYSWNITGGNIVTSQLNSISVKWNDVGNQTITLTCITPSFCVKTSSLPVRVTDGSGISVIGWDRGNLVIYPNPNFGIFTIATAGVEGLYELRVHDVTGRIVYMEDNIQVSGNFKKEVDIHAQVHGVYILTMTNKSNSFKTRLLIKK